MRNVLVTGGSRGLGLAISIALADAGFRAIAVARKLLHAIYGIFKSRTPYDGQKLFPALRIGCAIESTSR